MEVIHMSSQTEMRRSIPVESDERIQLAMTLKAALLIFDRC